ncbi:transposase [Saccharopolyspora shandongensis]|uniref:transposase n=1 Tax=Saccharopolyspora shandongensis TaxID=418495 RepID=UPI0033C75DC8
MDGSGRRLAKARLPEAIQDALRSDQLGQPEIVADAYAASVQALIAVLTVLNTQVKTLQGQVEAYFGQHPAAEIVLSQPGLGPILGARVLAEFGDDPDRYASAKARKNYAGTSPITRASGKKRSPSPGSSTTTDSSTPSPHKRSTRCCDPRRTRLLRPATSPRHRSQRRPAPARQPPRGHPARLPQDRHPLRRAHRLAPSSREGCCLTFKLLGCLSGVRHHDTQEPSIR